MTDNEIIKALECCQTNSCDGCPFDGFNSCLRGLPIAALDLIKRQQAEIERLKGWDRWIEAESHAPIIKKAKAEAINEFAERLRTALMAGGIYPVLVKNSIDYLVKEMTEDKT